MRFSLLGAAARAWSGAVALTLSIALLTAGVVITTLATSGRTVANERAVLSRIDDARLTTIEILDDQGRGALDAQYAAQVRGLSTVSWALALGPVEDLRPVGMSGADPVAARRVLGTSPALHHRDDVTQLTDVMNGAPVGVIGSTAAQRIGLADTVGALTSFGGTQVTVVGRFRTDPALAGLDDQVLIYDADFTGPVRRVILQVERPEDVTATAAALRDFTAAEGVRIVVAEDLARIRAAVAGELGGASRATVLQTMAAALALVALVMYASLHARRRDFGRRRALGATRPQLVTIVLLHTLLAAAPGAVVGAAVGSLVTWRLTGSTPGLAYPVAICVLAVLTALLAALLPALIAAFRDPVSALRVP